MTVHVFNPSHDEALAVNRAQYCPSAAARRTGAMFWDVARHWAAPDDVILHLPDDGSLRGVEVPDWSAVSAIEPWGWDRHIVGVLRRLGAPERLLPDEARLDALGLLSSRQTAVRVLEALRLLPPIERVLAAESRWCTTVDAVFEALTAYGGEAYCKQPWSCSGRGVWRCRVADWPVAAADSHFTTAANHSALSDNPSVSAANQFVSGANPPLSADRQPDSPVYLRVLKTLREQGAVEVEPVYERVADFAMEFFAEPDGRVRYEGLSFFSTHDGGGYAGNVIASQDTLRQQLESLAPQTLPGASGRLPLEILAERLCTVLASVLSGAYSGPLGVDMMLTPSGIHPCIEVNLRNTMGRVAIFQWLCRAQTQPEKP